jgi:CheY-like chemotaxis protein
MTLQTILIVEDDDAHAGIIERNLLRLGCKNPLKRFASGNAVLEFLEGQRDTTVQFALLLDINLPGLTGFQVMERLDENPALCAIPRILISTSDDPQDMSAAAKLNHLAYLIKPLDYKRILELIVGLDEAEKVDLPISSSPSPSQPS